jgi:hypothetical protein
MMQSRPVAQIGLQAMFKGKLSVVPVPDRAGRCAHFVMIQRDVSDRRRAEDDLRPGFRVGV